MNIERFNQLAAATATEFASTGLEFHQFFMWAIHKQNTIYELPINSSPSLDDLGEAPTKRMTGFLKTLQKEMDEGKEILALMELREALIGDEAQANATLGSRTDMALALISFGLDEKTAVRVTKAFHEVAKDVMVDLDDDYQPFLDKFILVSMADWLSDMRIYNRSEGLKYGLPLESVETIIMNSNFTKLGEDGLPIKNADGKFEKGPNYVAPERHIYALMFETQELLNEASDTLLVADAIENMSVPVLANPMNDVLAAVEALEDPDSEYQDTDSDE